MNSERQQIVGERANPHPSQAVRVMVEAVKVSDGKVLVRYVGTGPSWWITEQAWHDWVAVDRSRPRATKEGT